MIVRFFNILILVFSVFVANSQSKAMEKEVKAMFRGQNVETVHLVGCFNNLHRVELHLANNGDEWKGIAFYPSSNTKLLLDGGVLKNNLLLDELDSDNESVGKWFIALDKNNYPAKWSNTIKSIQYEIELTKLNRTDKTSDSRTVYSERYKGEILGEKYDFLIYKDGYNKYKANILDVANKEFVRNTIRCLDDDCKAFDVIVKSDKHLKSLNCQFVEKGAIKATAKNHAGNEESSVLKKNYILKMNEMSYISEMFQLYISYPKFNNENSKLMMDKEMGDIADLLKAEMAKLAKNAEKKDKRYEVFANVWFDIDFFSKDYFSGVLIIQKSYSKNIISKPFNILLKSGEKIDIVQSFDKDIDADFLFEKFIENKVKQLPEYKSRIHNSFLRAKNFKTITLNSEGIVFSTAFSSIFGTFKILYPYDKFKNVLNKRSILKDFYKSS